jgi:RNase P/RNase MRP subunit p29
MYNALNNLQGDLPQLFENSVVLVGKRHEIVQEPTKHDANVTIDGSVVVFVAVILVIDNHGEPIKITKRVGLVV